jgi:tRNA(Ile)-lysidine synthase
MADSKRFVLDLFSGQWPGSAELTQAIGRSVAALERPPSVLAVALSGGADSAMMTVHAAIYAQRRGLPLHCLHIHHGLQPLADQWQAHAHDLARQLCVPCHSLRVEVGSTGRDGMEAAAREARYRGLADLAGAVGARHVLLAHHRNDQAETVLLRLLRGAGPTGLAAMAPAAVRDGLVYLRPWLDIERSLILQQAEGFCEATGWQAVQDPTNADDKYTRAAVRERLVPELDARWPGWRGNLSRHARLSGELAQVLDEVAGEDFQRLEPSADARSFSLKAWRGLSPARQALALRYWLSLAGLRMPTEARLGDMMRQLRGLHALGHDRQMRVKHGDVFVCCRNGRVQLVDELPGPKTRFPKTARI